MSKAISKALIESSDDHMELSERHQNFSPVRYSNIASTKTSIKKQIVLLGLYLMTETRYFSASQVGHSIRGLVQAPQKRSTIHFSEDSTMNLILQLLLYKDKDIVQSTLSFLEKVFTNDHLLHRAFDFTTFWERVLYAGLRKGLALPALRVLTNLMQKVSRHGDRFNKQLTALERLFPAYVARWLSTHKPEDSKFLIDFEEKSDAEMYWTEVMFDQLKDTIGQIFPMDLQNLEDYYAGRKNALPKVRNPPVSVHIHYELPTYLLQVEGLFLNNLVDQSQNYDFTNSRLIPAALLPKAVDMLAKAISKPDNFTSLDCTVYSHIRILSRTVLRFIEAGRSKQPDILKDVADLCSGLAVHWIRHASRVSVRGPQISFDFIQGLIDLVIAVGISFELAVEKNDSEISVLATFQKITQKLLKKMTVDRNKLTYLEFKLFKATLMLESLLLKTDKDSIHSYFANMMNDVGTDIDFHLLYALKLVSDNVHLIQAAPTPESQDIAQDLLQVLDPNADQGKDENGPGAILSAIVATNISVSDASKTGKDAKGAADKDDTTVNFATGILKAIQEVKDHKKVIAQKQKKPLKSHTVPKVLNKLKMEEEEEFKQASADGQAVHHESIDILYDIKEFKDVKDTQNLTVLSQVVGKVLSQDDMKREASMKLIVFNAHLLDILSKLVEVPAALPGLVRNGLVYAILEVLLKINETFSLDSNDRALLIAQRYTGILRRVLVWGSEATIRHFGEDSCSAEVAFRGSKTNEIKEEVALLEEDNLTPLVEMYRVLKKTLHLRFISKAIHGFRSFENQDYQMEANEFFLTWLNSQAQAFDPEFIWTEDYSREIRGVLSRQITSIIYSRKANYSYYLDDFKSKQLSKYTRVGGIYLEPLVMSIDYKLEDPVGLLKRVNYL